MDKKAFDKWYSIVIDKNGTYSAIFSVVIDENGNSRIIFGDGKEGKRLPSGNDAIDAVYRRCYGGAGNALSEQPKGVRVFSGRKQAIESLGRKIGSDLMAKLSEEQGTYIVYLDVWKRDLTWLDDPTLRETALEGADTSARKDNAAKPKEKKSLT
jgi:Family of unknown function (DUF6519)